MKKDEIVSEHSSEKAKVACSCIIWSATEPSQWRASKHTLSHFTSKPAECMNRIGTQNEMLCLYI